MAVITLFSAAGSPGVTVSALGMALAWQRSLMLVDADPSGASAIPAGYLQGQTSHDRGLLDLAVANRMGDLSSAIATVSMTLPGSRVAFVPGVRSHQQAASVTTLWEPLGGVLRGMEQRGADVIVDAGRIGLEHAPQPLVTSADLALLVVRSDLPAAAGAAIDHLLTLHPFTPQARVEAKAAGKQPNILVIWGDDIGISNLSCYSDGLMGYRTPNIDRLATEGMRFTDSYGEQSCTAGRASFITGQSVYRTGMSKVGMPGVDVGFRRVSPSHRLLESRGVHALSAVCHPNRQCPVVLVDGHLHPRIVWVAGIHRVVDEVADNSDQFLAGQQQFV